MRLPLIVATLLLAGCGTLVTDPGEPPAGVRDAAPAGTDVERLVAHFERARRLPPAEFARESDASRQAYAKQRNDYNRLRYAMLLAMPGGAPGDDARALELLDPVVRNASSPLRALAVMLSTFVQEQRRLEAGSQALQQKLDALRSLERNLSERDQGAGGRRK